VVISYQLLVFPPENQSNRKREFGKLILGCVYAVCRSPIRLITDFSAKVFVIKYPQKLLLKKLITGRDVLRSSVRNISKLK
jgi:hypothetical protein